MCEQCNSVRELVRQSVCEQCVIACANNVHELCQSVCELSHRL